MGAKYAVPSDLISGLGSACTVQVISACSRWPSDSTLFPILISGGSAAQVREFLKQQVLTEDGEGDEGGGLAAHPVIREALVPPRVLPAHLGGGGAGGES